MDPPPTFRHLPNLILDEARVPSDRELDPRAFVKSKTSKLSMRRPGFDIEKTGCSEIVGKRTRDARTMSIEDAAHLVQSNNRQEAQSDSPLRLALARHSVKKQIFACMDQGDKKIEIESKTGLSHRCIKWHRRLWRIEGRHPRHRSGKPSKSSARRPRSPSTRNRRAVRRRQTSDEKNKSSITDESSSEKRRRKRLAAKQSKGPSMRNSMNTDGSGGGDCAGMETRASHCAAGKETVLGRNEAIATSGLRLLPIRILGP